MANDSEPTSVNETPPTDSSYNEALDYLYGRIDFERLPIMPYRTADLKLQRMRNLLHRLGNPQNDLKIIHVAGTKGKGSTCAMIASILEHAELRTGVYTSPHLHRLEERFVVAQKECTSEQFVDLMKTVRPAVEELDLESSEDDRATFFEITTAIAMLHFARQKVDFAILEVGLGGRLDSTNVCTPIVSVITSISFDHMKQLGNRLADIAFEKAGIIKPDRPVVSGVQQPEPRDVIRTIASERNSRLVEIKTDFEIDGEQCLGEYRSTISSEVLKIDSLQVALLGKHQMANAAVAVATCELLRESGTPINNEQILAGLRSVRCRARVEVVSTSPTIVIDAAHNGASAVALVDSIAELLSQRPSVLVFATTQGKDFDAILNAVVPEFDIVIFTRYLKNPRSVDPHDLVASAKTIRTDGKFEIKPTPASAFARAQELSGNTGLICVTGSFFIAAEVRETLGKS